MPLFTIGVYWELDKKVGFVDSKKFLFSLFHAFLLEMSVELIQCVSSEETLSTDSISAISISFYSNGSASLH